MWTPRFIVMTILAGVLAIAFGIAGGYLALDLARWKTSIVGIDRAVFLDPAAPGRIVWRSVGVFALQPVIAWVALAIRRGRGGRDVAILTAIVTVVALTACVVVACWLDASGSAMLFASVPTGIQPMVSIEDLAVGKTELGISVVTALGLWVGVAVRTRRA